MTGTSTPAIDIGGGRRADRLDSDRTSEDMSFIASPNDSFQLGISFVDIQNEAASSVADGGARATVHEANYSFATMPPLTEESDAPKALPEPEIPLLPGEERILIANSKYTHPVDGGNVVMTHYRIVFIADTEPQRILVFPLQEIEQVDLTPPSTIQLAMKGGRMHRLAFCVTEDATNFHKVVVQAFHRLNRSNSVIYKEVVDSTVVKNPNEVSEVFAWKFSEAVDALPEQPAWLKRPDSIANEITHIDFNRLEMAECFQITSVNEKFEVCPTYPEKVIVPKGISDDDIRNGAPYRSISRFPAVIWRCRKTRAVLLRSSQPQVGILSWRNTTDEKIIEEAVKASRQDGEDKKQFIILDARGYTSAFANRARSGGFENTEYYQQAKLEFLGLPNIHSVRASFSNIRQMLHNLGPNEQLLQNLQTTGWLNNVSNLLVNAANCADYLSKGHSVLVHCSDGWDRTTQVTTLAKVMLDEHYRTVEGFEQLIRRDWIAFGHKLSDRQLVAYGNWGDSGERSPIFLQFLEAVRHLQREQPTAFQFSHAYLIKLAQHAYSGLFGSFLFNSHKEKRDAMATKNGGTLVEIWRFIGAHNEEFVNQTYDEKYVGALRPMTFTVINLRVWHEVFADEGELYTQIYNTQPPKEERPSSGCATPMTTSTSANLIKSKSSESINSLNVDGKEQHQCSAHCSPCVDAGTNISMSSSFHQTLVSFAAAAHCGVSSLDHDGLLRFQDDEQAMLRRKNKARDEEIRRRDKEISELRRQRAISEKAGSLCDVGADDVDSDLEGNDGVLERAMSDLSIMEPENELPNFRPPKTWETRATTCCQCQRELNRLSVYVDARPHHCRNCGKVVCDGCSKQRYAVVEEGQSVQKRVCDMCYESMYATRLTSLSSSSPSPPSPSPQSPLTDSNCAKEERGAPIKRVGRKEPKSPNKTKKAAKKKKKKLMIGAGCCPLGSVEEAGDDENEPLP